MHTGSLSRANDPYILDIGSAWSSDYMLPFGPRGSTCRIASAHRVGDKSPHQSHAAGRCVDRQCSSRSALRSCRVACRCRRRMTLAYHEVLAPSWAPFPWAPFPVVLRTLIVRHLAAFDSTSLEGDRQVDHFQVIWQDGVTSAVLRHRKECGHCHHSVVWGIES